MKQKKEILFLLHNAARTGAPIVMLHFLRWLRQNTDISFYILLMGLGGLEEEFKKIAPTYVLHRPAPSGSLLWRKAYQRLRNYINAEICLNNFRNKILTQEIGLIYANTVATIGNRQIYKFLLKARIPVILHIHELEGAIRFWSGKQRFEEVQKPIYHYIAVSEAVRQNLIKWHNIKENNISVIYGFIPIQKFGLEEQAGIRNKIRQDLGIPNDALVVVASGVTQPRKGTGLFVNLASHIFKRHLDKLIHYVWVGGGDDRYIKVLQQDIMELGLAKYMHFTDYVTNPVDYFMAADIFALTSREDSFPLVMLEAASVGKPIVCFDGAGGAPEFVESDCGFIVPYLDVEAMADTVIQLCNSDEARQKLGQAAYRKVIERHNISVLAPRIYDTIKEFLK